ncbi:MAG: hypothetical protein HKN16_05190 [Saprospiraceae bacterium]|nr:hypothetical protein [Saprospiraceae bacterium]
MLLKILPVLLIGLVSNLTAQIEPVSLDEANEIGVKQSRLIFLIEQRVDCLLTENFKKTALQNPEVQQILQKHYVYASETIRPGALKLPDNLVSPYLQRKKNDTISPQMKILDKDQKTLQTFSGKITEQKLILILRYFAEEHYKRTPWEKFIKSLPRN